MLLDLLRLSRAVSEASSGKLSGKLSADYRQHCFISVMFRGFTQSEITLKQSETILGLFQPLGSFFNIRINMKMRLSYLEKIKCMGWI